MTSRPTVQAGQLSGMLETFGLKHAAKQLPDLLETAMRNYAAAHFPPSARPIEEFDSPELEGGITAIQVELLVDLSWLDAHGNVVLAGPPRLGKTMVALGLDLKAADEGYTVAYEKMETIIEVLDKAEVDRKTEFRLRYLKKAQLVIVDEIGCTPINKNQANKFFSFVSDAYERSSMIFTTNKEITQWEEFMGDQVLTTAMIDRILHHARCFLLRGESYRLKHPELYATT